MRLQKVGRELLADLCTSVLPTEQKSTALFVLVGEQRRPGVTRLG